MSIPVEIPYLAEALGEYDWAYLLTLRGDGRSHVVAVTPEWEGELLSTPVGKGTAAGASERPTVTLCYPPRERDGYSLIVDGTASVDGKTLRFAPEWAVLHRPAPEGFGGSSTGCGGDCVPVTSPD